MSTQSPNPQQQKDWSKHRAVVLITLLCLIITAIAGSLLVPPAWLGVPEFHRWWYPAPAPSPQPSPGPQPSPPPPPVEPADNQALCGQWQSLTSGKRYNFVCRGTDSFEIYEIVPGSVPVRVGFGRVIKRNVDVNFISREKGRTAILTLRLSDDAQTLEGIMEGVDERERGRLTFRKM
jgi:hypothetical protein